MFFEEELFVLLLLLALPLLAPGTLVQLGKAGPVEEHLAIWTLDANPELKGVEGTRVPANLANDSLFLAVLALEDVLRQLEAKIRKFCHQAALSCADQVTHRKLDWIKHLKAAQNPLNSKPGHQHCQPSWSSGRKRKRESSLGGLCLC